MKKFLAVKLPKNLVHTVFQICSQKNNSEQHARAFCAHWAINKEALTHFTVQDLIDAPELWIVSHTEGQRRADWRAEVYPKWEKNEIDITDSILQCGKCKKNTVDYYEKQTRGADEPMTIFAHCLSCGNQWRQ